MYVLSLKRSFWGQKHTFWGKNVCFEAKNVRFWGQKRSMKDLQKAEYFEYIKNIALKLFKNFCDILVLTWIPTRDSITSS